MEGGCKIFDELSEVYASIGNVVEDGFVAVTLILYVANLHVQPQVLSYLAAFNHSSMLTRFRLMVLVHVGGTCNAIDAAYFLRTLQVCFLDLQFHQAAGQSHHTDVMSGIGLYSHNVTLLQV